jgi:hypothetical protein
MNFGLLTNPGGELNSFAARNQIDQDHDDGDHQQDMDEPAHRGAGYQPEQPQHYQNDTYRPQHSFSFPFDPLQPALLAGPQGFISLVLTPL